MNRVHCLLVLAALTGPVQAQVTGRQAIPRPGAESVATVSHARGQYVLHCAGCHGMDGAGSSIGNVPDMRRLGQFLRLPGGRDFIIQVPGVMVSGLNDEEVAKVTNWVLAYLAPGSAPPNHQPYDAAEVQRARQTPLLDVAAKRAKLVRLAQDNGIALD